MLGVGAVVTAFTVTVGTLLELMFESKEAQNDGKGRVAFAFASIALSAANGFGTTFLSGVLDRTVGEHQHGHERESLWQLLRRIPYVALIVADILALLLKIFGFVLLIVPGFIAITLLSVVGPVVMIEGTGPVEALRRSAQLVRPFFWLTFVAVTIPIVFENLLGDALATAEWSHGFLRHLAVGVVIDAPVAIFVSLVEVTLAYHLIERDPPEAYLGSGLKGGVPSCADERWQRQWNGSERDRDRGARGPGGRRDGRQDPGRRGRGAPAAVEQWRAEHGDEAMRDKGHDHAVVNETLMYLHDAPDGMLVPHAMYPDGARRSIRTRRTPSRRSERSPTVHVLIGTDGSDDSHPRGSRRDAAARDRRRGRAGVRGRSRPPRPRPVSNRASPGESCRRSRSTRRGPSPADVAHAGLGAHRRGDRWADIGLRRARRRAGWRRLVVCELAVERVAGCGRGRFAWSGRVQAGPARLGEHAHRAQRALSGAGGARAEPAE